MIDIKEITENTFESCISKAVEVLRRGGVIIYPTDTLYGLGADATNEEAIEKIYAIKGRDENKPIHVIVGDCDMAEEYVELNKEARILAQKFLPGPLTLVLKKKNTTPSLLTGGRKTLGVRIPNNTFCRELARRFGKPITTTSANKSGEEPSQSIEGILKQLGEEKNTIDLALNMGEVKNTTPSTVVDVSKGEINILREGAIQNLSN